MKHLKDDAFWLTWCKEELAKGRSVHLPAKGWSMLPSIFPKTILSLEHKDFAAVEVGQIIAFERNLQFVVHRVVKIAARPNEREITTRGDSNWHADLPITKENFIGVIKGKVQGNHCKPILQPFNWVLLLVRLSLSAYRICLRVYLKTKQIFGSAPPNR